MSYTKLTFENNISKPVKDIQTKTISDNDFTEILKNLNAAIEIKENMTIKDNKIGELWNELIYDILSSIHSASCGFYRSAIIVLRSVLELGCNSFFFFDHKIEYGIFQNENSKADKYVSTLVNEFDFFKTKYIRVFYKDIDNQQVKEDSVSDYLKRLYANLSDIVHGRYNNLIKAKNLEIKYEKKLFKKFESLFFETLSILAVMYVLRFNDKSSHEIIELVNVSRVVNL